MMGFHGVTREENGTICIRFPEPGEEVQASDLPEEYVNRGYYYEIDKLTGYLDNDVLMLFGQIALASNQIQEEQDPSEMEEFLERLMKDIFRFDSIRVEVEG